MLARKIAGKRITYRPLTGRDLASSFFALAPQVLSRQRAPILVDWSQVTSDEDVTEKARSAASERTGVEK